MGRFERSLSLFRSSWAVLRADRELLALPVISGVVSLLVVATFAAPAWFSLEQVRTVSTTTGEIVTQPQPSWATYVVGAVFYLLSAFVVIFFNAALVHGANERFEGGDPTLRSALAGAWQRVGLIFQWAAVSATVSMIIRQIQERGGLLGKLLGGLLGFAWAVVTFLVLPTLVIEGVSVREAFRRSTESIRTTWGENLIGQGGLGLIGFLAAVPLVILAVVGVITVPSSVVLGVSLLAVAVLGLIVVSVVLSAMGVVYQTALYRYATDRPIVGYDQAALAGAFGPRNSRRRF